MAMSTDGSFQLDGASHASIFKREVGILLFGVWKGAAGIQKICVHEDKASPQLVFTLSLMSDHVKPLEVYVGIGVFVHLQCIRHRVN